MKYMDDAIAHARECYPHESCGFFIVKRGRKKYFPCTNLALNSDEEFLIGVEDYAAAEKQGEIVTVVHSHPDASALPSVGDLSVHKVSGLEWLIIGLNGEEVETHTLPAITEKPPLYGREFIHGVSDCYSFVRQYYQDELDIPLPDFTRTDQWWEQGQNLYMENFGKAGFEIAEDLRENDVILMCINSPVPNHAAVYLGDGMVGHHMHGRLSCREVYGQYYRQRTAHIVRFTKNKIKG